MASIGTAETPKIPDATRLAVDRTRLAHERTLMAWVRTAISLISFGFTLFKFFEYLNQDERVTRPARLLGARQFAILMICTGLLALVIATVEHHRSMQMLRAQYGDIPRSLAAIMACLIGLLGVVGLISVVLRS
ncbi:MAG TPA: DUF202 domain-containing protein [Candidatus Methylomirabilis sp.]|nr:DUF202 domain-containing protein [Candidatus Methylomirabilis sp.]